MSDYDLDQELHVFTEIHHTKGDLGAAIRLLTNARVIDIEEARRLSGQVEQVYPPRRPLRPRSSRPQGWPTAP